MATRTISNTGGDWNSTTTWAESAVPTSADAVVATATSGPLTINAAGATCASLVLTGYTSTFTINYDFTVAGSVTLAGTIVAGSTSLFLIGTASGTSTYTSNGINWPAGIRFNTSSGASKVFSGTWNIAGKLYFGTSSICSGGTLNISGGINAASGNSSYSGTVNVLGGVIEAGGTGAAFGASTFNLNGNITVGTNWRVPTGGITHVGGIITTTGSTLTVNSVSFNYTGSAITWNNLILASSTTTLLSDMYIGGSVTTTTGATNPIINSSGFSLYVAGDFIYSGTSAQMSGTATIIMNGTGILSTSTSATFSINITINTIGTITLGTVRFSGKILAYISGTVITTGSTVTIFSSSTLNLNGIVLPSLTFSNATASTVYTHTLISNLVCNTLVFTGGNGGTTSLTGNYSVTCDILGLSGGCRASFDPGTSLVVTTRMYGSGVEGVTGGMLSSTTTSRFVFNYMGSLANQRLILTDILYADASTSTVPVCTYGGTVTDCINVISYTPQQLAINTWGVF